MGLAKRKIIVQPYYLMFCRKSCLINKMELIRILDEKRYMNGSVRKILRRYSINDDAEFTQTLVEMHSGKVTRIVMNWLALNANDGVEIELRMFEPEEQMVYSIGLSDAKASMSDIYRLCRS